MYYVYILKSKKDSMNYIGSTNDLRKRFNLHNDGKVFSTRLRVPFDLVYYEAYKSRQDAMKRERMLKQYGSSLGHLKERITKSLDLKYRKGGEWQTGA